MIQSYRDASARAQGMGAAVFAAAVMTLGLVELAGALSSSALLKSFLPGLVIMKTNTATGLVVAGASLALLGLARNRRPLRWAGLALAALTILLGLTTLSQNAFGWDLGIDQLLSVALPGGLYRSNQGHMPGLTAICFTLLGVALVGLGFRKAHYVIQALALTVAVLALTVIGAYLAGASGFQAGTHAMALHTALGALLLTLGLLTATLDRGFLKGIRRHLPILGVWLAIILIIGSGASSFYNTRRVHSALAERLAVDIAARAGTMDAQEADVLAREQAAADVSSNSSLMTAVLLELMGLGLLIMMVVFGRRLNGLLEDRVRERTDELARANLALRMVSNCNKTLIRATDERQFVQVVCDLVVADGGFRACFVAYAQQDEEQSLRTVARAGEGVEGLATGATTWADRDGGRGPTGIAIRSGQPMILNDLADHTEVAGGAEGIRILGLTSAAALPLTFEGRIGGALVILSQEHQAFVEPEWSILMELSKDLGFGIGTLRDRVASRQLEIDRARAESSNRAKSAFLANMSHEIRTPMNAVLGFAQLLRRDPDATPQQKQHVNTIIRSGEHLLTLISDILEYSKIEAGRLAVEESTFDLRDLLEDLEVMFRMRAEGKNLRLLFELIPPGPCYLVSDENKLRQILQNLLANAVKFTERGGVALRATIEPGMGPGLEQRLMLEVEDSGPGIAQEEMARLFKVFEQTESGRKSKSGTGLGLAISRKFAELLGGKLDARSQLGEGSTFHLEIAVKQGSAASVESKLQPRRVVALAEGQKPLRVLVADDREDNRLFLETLLKSVGFEVRTVDDGAKAVAEFDAWRPQIILMDMRMPVMNGREAIGLVREHHPEANVKIIAVTASAFEEDRQQALESGADDFISKPFREEVLFRKLEALTGVRYRFAEEAPTRPQLTVAQPVSARRAALAALPRDLLTKLRLAALSADLDRIMDLAQVAEAQSPEIAQEIRRLAGGFSYKQLLALLEPGSDS